MNSIAVVAGATVAACVCSFVVVSFMQPEQPDPAVSAGPTTNDLDARLRELETERSALGEQLTRMQGDVGALQTAAARTADATVSDAVIEAAVRRLVESGALDLGALAAEAVPANASARPTTLSFESVFAQLASGQLGFSAEEALWNRAIKAGLIDRLVDAFAAKAKADPNNADVHSELGDALLKKALTLNDGPARGGWAMKADRAFDEALDIDPNHWEARFSKATSLSFWPPIMGRGPEAAKNFEILIEQQESSGVAEPHYAQSYLFLGNLYDQQGKHDEAKKVWQKGLGLHPTNAELQQKART